MTASPTPRVRRSLTDIEADYRAGKKTELETLMRAWKGIKELPPEDPNSFFVIGGFHGEPFRGAGRPTGSGGAVIASTAPCSSRPGTAPISGGLEDSAAEHPRLCGCDAALLGRVQRGGRATTGIPSALTAENFVLDGKAIPNPLRSFVLPVEITDEVKGDSALYSKPKQYETVRYPLSGLVGTPDAQKKSAAHNAGFPDPATMSAT